MFDFRKPRVSVAVALTLLLSGLCGQADAFTPRAGPLQDSWKIEGFIEMTAKTMDPANAKPPFDIDEAIVSNDVPDFYAGIIATFDAPDDGVGRPNDGEYTAELQYFRVQIGNTNWDESMFSSDMLFQVGNGFVTGASVMFTYTMPAHPDLRFMFPASPGEWQAVDERDGHNVGTIGGTYELKDGTVPEPATLSLLAIGALALIRRRRG